jgi:hypothetical protein
MQGADKRRLRRASNTPPEAASEGLDACIQQAGNAAKGIFMVNQGCSNIEASPRQATGNLHRKDGNIMNIRSLTPPKAAGNALTYAFQGPWIAGHGPSYSA